MKTFSNLVQGIVLGYVNQNEYTKEYQRHLKSVKSQFSDEDVFDQLSQDDPYGHVSSAHVNTYQYEENYLYLRNKDLIRTYKSNHIDEALGFGYQSAMDVVFATKYVFKKLFKQWNLALQAKQSMAEAYQSIADTLGLLRDRLAIRSYYNLKCLLKSD